MKVLTVIHDFDPGGVERVALRLVREWRRLGLEAPLFVGFPEGSLLDDVGAGLAFHAPRQPRIGRWRISTYGFRTIWTILNLPRLIRSERPDVLFCPGNTYAVVGVAMRLLLGRKCPPVVLKISNRLEGIHGWLPLRLAYRLWLRVQGRMVASAVAMDAAMVPEILHAMKWPPGAVAVVPDPALTASLHARLAALPALPPRGDGGRRFVAVGRLAAQKNLPLMLRAFAAAARDTDRLDLIGEGEEMAALETLIGQLGLAGRVRLLGYRSEPALLLGQYHALLLSSDFEGVPAVLLEALAAGVDVIATRSSDSVGALLAAGRAAGQPLGTVVEPGDEAGFSAALAAFRPGRQDRSAAAALVAAFTAEAAAPAYWREMIRIRALDHAENRSAATAEIRPSWAEPLVASPPVHGPVI